MPVNENLRQRILDDLSSNFSQDRIGIDEYEQRVQAVTAAKDDLELVAVNADILSPTRYQGGNSGINAEVRPGPIGSAMINYGTSPAHKDSIAIFSSADLNGEFLAPRKIDAVSIFGGTNIDLRRAAIPLNGMTIEAVAIFGGITILVPSGTRVQVDGAAIFGGFTRPPSSYEDSGPLIKITGAAIFGGVEVRYKA